MTARNWCATLCCGVALCLTGCIYSGAQGVDAPGFSSTYFRYQMQAQEQATVARKQREVAAAVAAQQAGAAEAASQTTATEVAENPSWWERFKSRFR